MNLRLSRPFDQFVAAGGQLLLVFAGLAADSRVGWTLCLAAMAALSLYGWLMALRRRRAIADTPTAKIASAAQGYVELGGTGALFADQPLRSPLTGLPCLWYRFVSEEKDSDGRWQVSARGESTVSIVLRDTSGTAVVDPEGAEIVSCHKERWQQGDARHTEWKFIDGDPLYVLGDLRTMSGGIVELDAGADLRELLADWKRTPQALAERFDVDRSGEIDAREWQLARAAARREVAQRHRETRAQGDTHCVRAPRDGRPYLIANVDPERLARRFAWWGALHIAVFVGALAALPWVWRNFPE